MGFCGFTAQYNVKRLVHYELFGDMSRAIARPDWHDLAPGLGLTPLPPGG
jgi:putative endonuclease